jgi:hypothetical protein
MSAKTARNIVIVLAIAALIAFVPGSGTAASVITHAVTLAFLGSLAWFGTVLYRQNRSTIYGLGDRRRAALYLAIGAAVFALSATSLMWSSSTGSVAWLVIMGAAVYTTVMIVLAVRR